MKTGTYNGHKNWNYWNVALWIGNDEGLYRLALECKRNNRGNSTNAAKEFIDAVRTDKTPDGAPYVVGAVRAALTGLE